MSGGGEGVSGGRMGRGVSAGEGGRRGSEILLLW